MNQRQTILIVEDEKINRKIITKVLGEEYDLLEAENGIHGFNALERYDQKISAILLDLTMPIMDGYEFLKRIGTSKWNKIPIIVMTGDANPETEKEVLDLGAWDFVPKPYNTQILKSRLVSAISKSKVDVYKQIHHMSEHDPLTGLHNRQKMFANTGKMITDYPEQEFVFLKADLDHFSLYNTTFGEEDGNDLLVHYADLIREFCDVYELHAYGRISADIFCACIPWDGDEKRLRNQVEELNRRVDAYKADYVLEISVGVCVVEKGMKVEDLYHRASFGAKKCKNRFGVHLGTYSKEEIEQEAENIAIVNDMQKALDEEQFVVYIQPKFNLLNDKVCGGEALVRWKHPVKGLISPGRFIPVFEQNGFISKVDFYVWEHTCKRIHEWVEAGYQPDPISVNVSRVSLYNPHLDKVLIELIERYDLSPELLELEITESAYMTSPGLMNGVVKKLHQAGFTILIDDFGSEYSSLNTLKNMDIDVLKIDMKFIPKEDDVEKGEIIIASMIKMAKWLGVTVICEGVETRRERDFLEGAGCDIIQGFFYAKPMPKDEYEKNYVIPWNV
ncbi:MAG: EAL domain-containing protein [Anaerostipes sp.]|nr:EAL domain-containing protein [Anaerostipes sp.]MDD3746684.1 EAL domain-containing protein [Anaerostipes sp.]